MIIKQRICDICGNEITDKHPTRLKKEEYDTSQRYKQYKSVATYDICNACCSKLPKLFKSLKEDE